MSNVLANSLGLSPRERELLARAERAENSLRELLTSLPQAYIALDRDWTITYANPEAARINRMPAERFVGKNVWDIWPELVGTAIETNFRIVLEQQISVSFEHYSPDYDAWFELHVVPTDEGLGVFYRDSTLRRRAEEALRQSEQRYRVFTELNPQLILTADSNGQVNYVNERLLNYSGQTMEEAAGEGWRATIHPEDEMYLLHSWMEAVARDDEFDAEARIRRGSDGAYRWFLIRGLPIRDEQQKTQHWLGVCVDIHERKMAVEALKEMQKDTERQWAELETLYRTAPIGLALFDPVEFRYLRLNDRQAEIVGLPKESILGRTVTEIAPIPGLHEMFCQVAAGTPVRDMLLQGELPMQPGVHRYWAVNYYPVRGADGAIQAITAASLEITAQKRAEFALIQSEKLAAVGRLASSISHEINNPLEAVTNLLYLAAGSDGVPEEVAKLVRAAQQELARVSQIATQSLRFHRQTMDPTWVTAEEMFSSVLDLYQGRLFNSDIWVHTRYRSTRRIFCLENDVRQVLNNLIANAIDAIRSGGSILVRAHDATDPNTGRKGVVLTVADTGQGMSAEAKKRAFEAFYTTKDLNGTGLGLWISSGIISRHEGHIALRSKQGTPRGGTVFRVFLPCKPDISFSVEPA